MKSHRILDRRCSGCGRLTLGILGGKEVCFNTDKLDPCPSQRIKQAIKPSIMFQRGFVPGNGGAAKSDRFNNGPRTLEEMKEIREVER
ncbi:MAG: hypothetical protein GY737_26830 [Desulfobacteraceae bacterium]|nr:hypothetical protein [Desulfobacteraceae bacterium]